MKNEQQSMAGIVANGRQIILASEGYKKRAIEIRHQIEERHAADYATASWAKKFLVRSKIEREFQSELTKLAPPHALYLAKVSP